MTRDVLRSYLGKQISITGIYCGTYSNSDGISFSINDVEFRNVNQSISDHMWIDITADPRVTRKILIGDKVVIKGNVIRYAKTEKIRVRNNKFNRVYYDYTLHLVSIHKATVV